MLTFFLSGDTEPGSHGPLNTVLAYMSMDDKRVVFAFDKFIVYVHSGCK